ncbi:MAG TPA: DUF3098 domain-containing protein [Rubricoccaceae bacterium]
MAKRSPSRRPVHPVARPAAGRSALRGAATMPFGRTNYRLLLVASGVIVLGYALMVIDNATSDNPVDSVLSLYVAPLLLLAGYLGVAAAVLWGVPRDGAPEAVVPPAAPDAV